MCIRRTVGCKNKEQWQEICGIKYKQKWERMLKKNESPVEKNLDE
jgi:hypothetical protein